MTQRERKLVAVQTVKVVICDRCGCSEGNTERYSVAFPNAGRRTFDLCPVCAEPLRELATLLDKVGHTGPKRHQQPILTVEEVEARVRRARRKRKA